MQIIYTKAESYTATHGLIYIIEKFSALLLIDLYWLTVAGIPQLNKTVTAHYGCKSITVY